MVSGTLFAQSAMVFSEAAFWLTIQSLSALLILTICLYAVRGVVTQALSKPLTPSLRNCPRCNYLLSGLPPDEAGRKRCPECGEHVNTLLDTPLQPHRVYAPTPARIIVAALILLPFTLYSLAAITLVSPVIRFGTYSNSWNPGLPGVLFVRTDALSTQSFRLAFPRHQSPIGHRTERIIITMARTDGTISTISMKFRLFGGTNWGADVRGAGLHYRIDDLATHEDIEQWLRLAAPEFRIARVYENAILLEAAIRNRIPSGSLDYVLPAWWICLTHWGAVACVIVRTRRRLKRETVNSLIAA